MVYPRRFRYREITQFYTFYVAGIEGASKIRAHTSLPKYRSSWYDHALLHNMHWPSQRTWDRIQRHLNGIKNLYPHTAKQDTPLLLDQLVRIAALLGIECADDLERCALANLVFWARLITAHGACLRQVEHSLGMQVKDVDSSQRDASGASLTFLTVGRREGERKLKHRERTVPLCSARCISSAGHVLRVLIRRVHGDSSRDATLFPDLTGSRFTGRCRPWAHDLRRLRALCARVTILGTITGCSLRAGGATDLFRVGASNQFVKHQGGWRSYAFVRYDRPTPSARVFLATKYARRLRSLLSAHTQ